VLPYSVPVHIGNMSIADRHTARGFQARELCNNSDSYLSLEANELENSRNYSASSIHIELVCRSASM
jgi:hypothetical protein